MVVVPGVLLVETFAISKSLPAFIVSWAVIEPTLTCDEVMKTVLSSRDEDAFPFEPSSETITAG
jgi:hypothetical protein